MWNLPSKVSVGSLFTNGIIHKVYFFQGAACQEIMEEMREKENAAAKKSPSLSKVKRTQSSISGKILEGINEIPSQENLTDKENKSQSPNKEEAAKKADEKQTGKKKVVRKKVLADKNENEKGMKTEEEAGKEKEIEKTQVCVLIVGPIITILYTIFLGLCKINLFQDKRKWQWYTSARKTVAKARRPRQTS